MFQSAVRIGGGLNRKPAGTMILEQLFQSAVRIGGGLNPSHRRNKKFQPARFQSAVRIGGGLN